MEFTSENYKQYFDSKKYNSLTPDQRSQLIRFTVNEEGSKRGLSDIHLEFKGVADGWTHGNRGSMGSRDMGDHVRHYMQLNEDVLTRDGKLRIHAGVKIACPESHLLSNFEDVVKFNHWYFGHFHIDAKLSDKYTVLLHNVVKLGE